MYDDEKISLLSNQRFSRSNYILKLSLILSLLCCVGLLIAITIIAIQNNGSKYNCESIPNNVTQQDLYLHAAVSSDAEYCANIANNIMMVKGGNAIDGAIAGLICDCAINFHSCGIGGGSFVVIYIKKDKLAHVIDIREEAPASANKNMFVNNPQESIIGGKSIAVMGLINGYYEIFQKFGSLPWDTLFQQTIDLLNNGYYISKSLESAINYFVMKGNKTEFSELWSIISDPLTGKPKKFGDIIKSTKLSKTLSIIAKEPYAMKNGSLVDVIIREIKASGGIVTKEDLNNYTVKWRNPVTVTLKDGQTLYTVPPPSSGALIAFSLQILQQYPFDSSSLNSCKNAELFFHRFIETMKFAYAKRSLLGDMDFVDVKKIMDDLTSNKYAQFIKSMITDDRTHPINYYNGTFIPKEDHGTSHFSLLASNGDAVSSTSTINYLLGSFVVGSETGILYNDEMDDFSTPNATNIYDLPPSQSNFIEPKKRPMSSMTPIIITDKNGDVILITGASGGSKIISATALVSTLTILLKRSIKESIDQPRAHNQLFPNKVEVEQNFPRIIIEGLKKRGHVVFDSDDHAVTQGIHKSEEDNSYFECNADFRKMGKCDGF